MELSSAMRGVCLSMKNRLPPECIETCWFFKFLGEISERFSLAQCAVCGTLYLKDRAFKTMKREEGKR